MCDRGITKSPGSSNLKADRGFGGCGAADGSTLLQPQDWRTFAAEISCPCHGDWPWNAAEFLGWISVRLYQKPELVGGVCLLCPVAVEMTLWNGLLQTTWVLPVFLSCLRENIWLLESIFSCGCSCDYLFLAMVKAAFMPLTICSLIF